MVVLVGRTRRAAHAGERSATRRFDAGGGERDLAFQQIAEPA